MSVGAPRPITVPAGAGELPAGLGALDAIGAIRHLAPRESLVLEGDAAESVHRVLAGAVAGYKTTADGRRQIVAFYFPDDLVGLTTVDARYAHSAEAIDRVSVCTAPHARLGALALRAPALRDGLLEALRRETAAAHERLLWLGRKTARERLACFVLECAGRVGRTGPDGRQSVPLPMSQPVIGDYLGLASETVSRTLADLARDGAIEVARPFTGVVVRDRQRLEAAADPGMP